MKQVVLTIPTFAFIVATRAALGVGIGLLVSSRMPQSRRRRSARRSSPSAQRRPSRPSGESCAASVPHRRDARRRPGRIDA